MGIFSLIGAGIAGALFSGSTLAATLISTGLGLGARVAQSYLGRKKSQPMTAVQGQVEIGAETDCLAAFGINKVSGQLVYYAKLGPGNGINVFVYRLAQGWCDGLEPIVEFYGKTHTLIPRASRGGEARRYFVDGFDNKIEFRFYDGRPGQTADDYLVQQTAGLDRPWKATSTGTNICYVIVEQHYDVALFEQGRPEYGFILRGLREYDPRYDSTVPGGSGAQRITDPSTWGFTTNPPIHRLNYQLGVRGVLSGRAMVGRGFEPYQIDMTTHMVAANVSDAQRMVDGVLKDTYACSLLVRSSADYIEVEREFEDAMAGYAVPVAGLSGVIAGAPQVPVVDIQPHQVRANAGKKYKPSRNVLDAVNVLSGQYTEPNSQWGPEPLDVVTVNADIAEDGRKLQKSNDFLQVTDADIAQYLLNIRYRQNRHQQGYVLPVTRDVAYVARLGSWVTYDGVTWLVTGWSFDARFEFVLTLAETSALIYDDADIQPGPLVQPRPSPVNPSVVRTLANFNVEAGVITDNEGYQVPALEFSWAPPSDPTITEVFIRYREAGTTTVYPHATRDVQEGVTSTSKDVKPGTVYEAQAVIITNPPRLVIPTDYVSTVTETVPVTQVLTQALEAVQPTLQSLNARADEFFNRIRLEAANSMMTEVGNRQRLVEFRETFGEAEARFSEDIRLGAAATDAVAQKTVEIETSIDENNTLIADQITALTNADQSRAETIRILQANFDFNSALVAAELEALVDADQSQINALSLMRSDFDQNSATVATQLQTLADADSAFAELVSGLQTATANATADGLVRYEAESDPSGAQARISQLVRASSGDNYVDAADITEVIATPDGTKSRKILKMKELIVLNDDGSESAALTVINGKTTMNIARANSFVMDEDISSSSGKVRFGTLGVGKEGLAVYD